MSFQFIRFRSHRRQIRHVALRFSGANINYVDIHISGAEAQVYVECLLEHEVQALLDEIRGVAGVHRVEEAPPFSKIYGKPLRAGNTNTKLIPLNGVFRYATWRIGKRQLFVAAAREDRECPMWVVLGATSGGAA